MQWLCTQPLTTDDECTCHPPWAACYQLAHEDRVCTSKKGGIGKVGRCRHGVLCTQWLSWLVVKSQHWLDLFVAQIALKPLSL